jgi:hypothetical protein
VVEKGRGKRMSQQKPSEVPEPITGDIKDLEKAMESLPELPPGMKWGLEIHAETEVVHPDGTVTR